MSFSDSIHLFNEAFQKLDHFIASATKHSQKEHRLLMAHFIHYYKVFNDLFIKASEEDQKELYGLFASHIEHFKPIRDRLALSKEKHPLIKQTKVDALLSQALQFELDRLTKELRYYKKGSKPKKKRLSSQFYQKI
ncbi:MAG: hypothetical protein FJZ56_02545 [Chlamydiae bacterium]|nr:hypothetical protein [Chlamydiota bacterium]